MSEAWIRLQCPACGEDWEDSPSDLPPPGETFECRYCGARHPASEFTRTQRDFEILREFHET